MRTGKVFLGFFIACYICLYWLRCFFHLIIAYTLWFGGALHGIGMQCYGRCRLVSSDSQFSMLGCTSAAITALLALLTTFVVHRYRFLGRAHQTEYVAILILPDLLLAVALLIGFHVLGLHFGFITLLLAHIAFSLPFACMILFARWQQEDPHLIEAAQDLGASEWQLFWRVVAPRLLSAVLTVLMLAFTLSFDDVVISFFVSGPSFNILPLHILAQARVGASPEINALCSILLLLTVLVVLFSQRRFRRNVCDHSV